MIDEENKLEEVQSSVVDPVKPVDGSSEPMDLQGDEPIVDNGLDQAFAEAIAAESETTPIVDTAAQAKLAVMETEVRSLKAQLEDRSGQYMRIAADFDNYRKRTQREKEELEQQIKCSTINELLPVVDNFERARSHIKPQTEQETTIHKSYQSVYKQLVDCMKRVGVSPMRAEGKEFDPNLHEAVMRQPTADHPEGVVLEELQRGYMLGDRVLRHALVKVAAPPDPMVTSEETSPDASEG
jgi:molecular chaperone GrpE